MRNKEKFDLRELDIMMFEDWKNQVVTFNITHNGKSIHDIILPLDKKQYMMKEYNDWLEWEIRNDENC